ncbi:WRC [Musa troglodytarum]|uniref:WRC n=1 Tax=Musa troglodytarum TaxID=320322 RepID=A0A9E7J9Y2_9LILI|nr:WRC [Musa troglodytarum]
MRIRKRPSLTSLPVDPDPSLRVHPPNGRHAYGSRDDTGEGSLGVVEGLHPIGDLPVDSHDLGWDPYRRPDQAPASSDSSLDSRISGSRAASCRLTTLERAQVLKEVEEEEPTVESNEGWHGQANSSKRFGGSSGAVASGAALLGETMSTQKKPRGGRDDGHGDGRPEEKLTEQGRKAKARARAKTGPAPANNNCTSPKDGDKERRDGGVAVARAGNGSGIKGKRRRSPAVLVEGSRCSRVNGRGWRCCQQTLVGYSLCEHHLGKGRLRSVSSVRGQLGTSQPRRSIDGKNGVLSSTSPREDENEEEEERKKRKTIGMVKARSISSLLDDTNHSLPSSLPSPPPEVEPMPSPSPTHGNEAGGQSQSNGQCGIKKENRKSVCR